MIRSIHVSSCQLPSSEGSLLEGSLSTTHGKVLQARPKGGASSFPDAAGAQAEELTKVGVRRLHLSTVL